VSDEFYSEQEQWERVKKWLRENGPWLVAGIVLGLAALAGWRWWEQRVERRAQEAGVAYERLLETLNKGDRDGGTKQADALRAEYSSSAYADQADFAIARALIESGELMQGAQRLTRVMDGSKDQELRLIARHRLARVQISLGKPDEALKMLSAAQPGTFAARYAEVRGDALFAKGDKAGALAEFRKARDTQAVAGTATVDAAGLELKIADLEADGIGAASPQKAKP